MGQRDDDGLLELLRGRFDSHGERHPGIAWGAVAAMLDARLMDSLHYMEESGGEPDVVVHGATVYFWDFSAASPKGRRSLCYDKAARFARKKNAPDSSAVEEAEKHGLVLLSESQYLFLQGIEAVDEKTSSWIRTDDAVRGAGGALFGDRRFGRTFVYCNGADSYYSARGFRAALKVGSIDEGSVL